MFARVKGIFLYKDDKRTRHAISLTGQLIIGKRLNQPKNVFFLQRRASVTDFIVRRKPIKNEKKEGQGTDDRRSGRRMKHSAYEIKKKGRRRSVSSSPGHHNEEVHDVPNVAQIGAAVEDEAEGEDLEAGLDAEDPEEVDLRGLELLCE